MSAIANMTTAIVRRLDKLPETQAPLTERDVQDPTTLVRLISGLLRDTTKALGIWRPRYIDFEDIPSTGTAVSPYFARLTHNFNGRVRYWPVGIESAVSNSFVWRKDSSSTDNVLVVRLFFTSTVTIRVEEAG